MSIGTPKVKTLADFGVKESAEFARGEAIRQTSGLNYAPYVEKQVEVFNVQSIPLAAQQESNLHVPPAQNLALFSLPKGWFEQRRDLFGVAIAASLNPNGLTKPGQDILLESEAIRDETSSSSIGDLSGAQNKQKQVFTNCFALLAKLDDLLLSVRNNMGRLRQA